MSLPLPVASLIDLFDRGPITITRATAGAINAYGEVDSGVTSTVIIDVAAVHVLAGRDLDVLPEADRARESIKVYTREALYTSQGSRTADLVTYQGRLYRVITATDIDGNGAVWVSVAQLVDVGGPP
jgi:hypothetical protein